MRRREVLRSLFSIGGLPIPAGQAPVRLVQADGKGPAVDAVYLPPGRVAYVRATSLSGVNARAGTRYLISDTGVRFAVHDDDAANDLGLPATMVAAPWSVLAALPAGPELSRTNASVAQDVPATAGRSRVVVFVLRERTASPPARHRRARRP